MSSNFWLTWKVLWFCGMALLPSLGFARVEAAPDAVAAATVVTPPPSNVQSTFVAHLKPQAGSRAKGSFTGSLSARKGLFRGTLKLPLPNSQAGIADVAAAGTANLLVELSRQGQIYAQCDLVFDALAKKGRIAKYGLSVIGRNGAVSQQAGLCELLVAPYGQTLPMPLAQDQLAIKALVPDGERLLAIGTFRKR